MRAKILLKNKTKQNPFKVTVTNLLNWKGVGVFY